MVRNSVGAESYVADEILVARSGQRVRVVNTDAEGRLAMADALYELRVMAETAVKPCVCTIATLTGHAAKSYGPYSALMGNGAALEEGWVGAVLDAGVEIGDIQEHSIIRREDFSAVRSRYATEDLLHMPTVQDGAGTVRGHQIAMAFLSLVGGVAPTEGRVGGEAPGTSPPPPYMHFDIAGSTMDYPTVPSGSPVAALVTAFALEGATITTPAKL